MAATISHDPRRIDVSTMKAPQVRHNYGNLLVSGSSGKKRQKPIFTFCY